MCTYLNLSLNPDHQCTPTVLNSDLVSVCTGVYVSPSFRWKVWGRAVAKQG